MHSSGSMARKFGPSWKQSTGQTSTQSMYLHLIQFSVTTKVIQVPRGLGRGRLRTEASRAAAYCATPPAAGEGRPGPEPRTFGYEALAPGFERRRSKVVKWCGSRPAARSS